MADMLHKAIQAMSLEEEEPLTLPDSPRFRVFDENERSLLGRLLNPDCQSMARMIEYMPTAWRVYDRVRGIALSRDRFQFVWTANPPERFLQSMELWIRILHILVNLFTTDTMFSLASEVGKVVEIAYDPKVSLTKDYIRALILFNIDNPVKAARKLNVSKTETITIEYEYEKIHKRCFHWLRLTHEKIRCPMLRRGANRGGMAAQASRPALEVPVASELLEGPPGFSLLFPELSKEDRKMAMMYISHADETERKARILRVQQGIEESKAESSIRLTRITKELDKGKGHVFSYNDHNTDKVLCVKGPSRTKHALVLTENEEGEGEAESSASQFSFCSEPVILTGFRLGPSTEGRFSRQSPQKVVQFLVLLPRSQVPSGSLFHWFFEKTNLTRSRTLRWLPY
ncbi:hypothetical protein Bca101_051133 [Brassica carinata]